MKKKIIKKLIELKKKSKLKQLQLHEPLLDNKEVLITKDIIEKGYISTAGDEIKLFENEIQKYTKIKNIILTNSGTSALHAILIALNIKADDEVLVQSNTFVGTINPIIYCKAIPNFVDIDSHNLSICPYKLDVYLKKNTKIKNGKCFNNKTKRFIKAIIVVHVFGNVGYLEEIKNITKKYKIHLIEDSAEAFGSIYKRKHTCNYGIAGIFSFNGNKIISTGAGGAVATNNSNLAKKIKHLISTSKIKHKFLYIHNNVGYNYRMPNICASLGLSQISKINYLLKQKRELHFFYKSIFENIDGIRFYLESKDCTSNHWLNCIMLNKKDKKMVYEILNTANKQKIYLRPLWNPMHSLKFCKKFPKDNLDNTIKAFETTITLPSSAQLNEKFK